MQGHIMGRGKVQPASAAKDTTGRSNNSQELEVQSNNRLVI